jgi:hypothetical protein
MVISLYAIRKCCNLCVSKRSENLKLNNMQRANHKIEGNFSLRKPNQSELFQSIYAHVLHLHFSSHQEVRILYLFGCTMICERKC